jgi:putative two-component system hydrogenase maturation factor HypX/HoxX
MGFLDDAFGNDAKTFEVELRERAARLAQDPELRGMLQKKHKSRLDDEYFKPLASYRTEELDRMAVNFFGPNGAYHEARRRFVFKGKTRAQESRPSVPGKLEEPQTIFLPVRAQWS